MPAQPSARQWQAIEEQIAAGRRIEAIKLYREAAGCSLRDAMRAVEQHQGVSPGATGGEITPTPPGDPQVTDAQWQAIEDALFAGQKIQAIKLFRQAAQCDLKDAKEAMDRHEADLRQQFPDRFAARRGCGAAVLLLGAAVTMLYFSF